MSPESRTPSSTLRVSTVPPPGLTVYFASTARTAASFAYMR